MRRRCSQGSPEMIEIDMLSRMIERMKRDAKRWEQCKALFRTQTFPAKTVLLGEGEIARTMYIVREGCLRLWFNKEGEDITFQFFFENQAVSSFESFFGDQPSIFTLESIEPTTAITISRGDWGTLYDIYPELQESFHEILIQRMGSYAKLFLSMIKNTPRERYEALQKEQPEILRRVSQRYIASYLGITPVSLSRIRGRIARDL